MFRVQESDDTDSSPESQQPPSQQQKSKRLLNVYLRYSNLQRPSFKKLYPTLSSKELNSKIA